jgi:hypothetical protein
MRYHLEVLLIIVGLVVALLWLNSCGGTMQYTGPNGEQLEVESNGYSLPAVNLPQGQVYYPSYGDRFYAPCPDGVVSSQYPTVVIGGRRMCIYERRYY